MKYFFGFLAAVTLIVVVFILIIRGLGGGRPKLQTQLIDYAKTQTIVRMTVEGPVKADQDQRSVTTTVGRSTNIIELRQGYQNNVIDTKSYASNEEAYATFLRALDLQGYTKGNDDPDREDSRGVCPTGRVYTFEIVTGSSNVQRFWTTSCGGGTFKGKTDIIRRLFRAQIPEYAKVTRNTGLN
jgi:hypothetical protein